MVILLSILIAILIIAMLIAFKRMSCINSKVNNLYSNIASMDGYIVDHASRINANANEIQRVSKSVGELEHWKQKLVYTDKETGKVIPLDEMFRSKEETVAEDENKDAPSAEDEKPENVPSEIEERRAKYAKLREQGMGVKSAGSAVGVSYTTAKRYEQWYQTNKK